MKLKLIFGDPDSERVKFLQQGFENHPEITALDLKPNELRALPDLDALYLSIMAAERWGSFVPRPSIHEARVLSTAPEDQANGWPPFVISGIALREGEDPSDARFGLPLIIHAVIGAVERFNEETGGKIKSIGFESEWTGIYKLPPLEAARIICAAYDEELK